jgi:hypothetical protein
MRRREFIMSKMTELIVELVVRLNQMLPPPVAKSLEISRPGRTHPLESDH